jgi:hypothetical protein
MKDRDVHYWITIRDENDQLIESTNSSNDDVAEARTVFNGLKSSTFSDYNAELVEVGSEVEYEGKKYRVVDISLRINAARDNFTEFHALLTVKEA